MRNCMHKKRAVSYAVCLTSSEDVLSTGAGLRELRAGVLRVVLLLELAPLVVRLEESSLITSRDCMSAASCASSSGCRSQGKFSEVHLFRLRIDLAAPPAVRFSQQDPPQIED